MPDLMQGAKILLREHDPAAVAPGFTDRLDVAARGGVSGGAARTITASCYPTDPGVHPHMAVHRLAAAEIKRSAEPERGVETLDENDQSRLSAEAIGEIGEGDRLALASAIAIPRILARTTLKCREGARTEVERAPELATVDGPWRVKHGEPARYTAQKNITIAQLIVVESDANQASPSPTSDVESSREHTLEAV